MGLVRRCAEYRDGPIWALVRWEGNAEPTVEIIIDISPAANDTDP